MKLYYKPNYLMSLVQTFFFPIATKEEYRRRDVPLYKKSAGIVGRKKIPALQTSLQSSFSKTKMELEDCVFDLITFYNAKILFKDFQSLDELLNDADASDMSDVFEFQYGEDYRFEDYSVLGGFELPEDVKSALKAFEEGFLPLWNGPMKRILKTIEKPLNRAAEKAPEGFEAIRSITGSKSPPPQELVYSPLFGTSSGFSMTTKDRLRFVADYEVLGGTFTRFRDAVLSVVNPKEDVHARLIGLMHEGYGHQCFHQYSNLVRKNGFASRGEAYDLEEGFVKYLSISTASRLSGVLDNPFKGIDANALPIVKKHVPDLGRRPFSEIYDEALREFHRTKRD